MHKVPFSALSPFPPAITVAGLMDILPDSLLLLSSSCDTRCYITCFKFKIVAWAFLHGQHLRSASLPFEAVEYEAATACEAPSGCGHVWCVLFWAIVSNQQRGVLRIYLCTCTSIYLLGRNSWTKMAGCPGPRCPLLCIENHHCSSCRMK